MPSQFILFSTIFSGSAARIYSRRHSSRSLDTMNYRNHAPRGAVTRRQSLKFERDAQRSRGRRSSETLARAASPRRLPEGATTWRPARSGARGGIAIILIALLAGTYLLPAYATPESGATEVFASQSVPIQSLSVADTRPTRQDDFPERDSFSAIKAVPGAACPVFNKGIDITPGLGTPIQAIADGIVTQVGANDADYGTNLIITHQIDGQIISSRYAHMVEGSSPLAVGDRVSVGDLVGQVGNTGISTGPHLHFEILLDGVTPTDPYVWMKAKIGS